MSRKSREPLTQNETPQAQAVEGAAISPAPPSEQPRQKFDYRIKLKPGLLATPFVTLKGLAGDEAEAIAELHRWLDAAIIGVECNPQCDPKTLEDITDGKAKFADGSAVLLPEGLNVEQDRDVWNVSLAGKLFTWRKGFSWNRITMECEQIRCAVDRVKRAEKPKLFAGAAR